MEQTKGPKKGKTKVQTRELTQIQTQKSKGELHLREERGTGQTDEQRSIAGLLKETTCVDEECVAAMCSLENARLLDKSVG